MRSLTFAVDFWETADGWVSRTRTTQPAAIDIPGNDMPPGWVLFEQRPLTKSEALEFGLMRDNPDASLISCMAEQVIRT